MLVTGGCGFIGSNFIRHILNVDSSIKIINLDKLTYAGNELNLLGLSKKAGLLEIGYDKVLKAIKDETVDAVLIDKEADKLKTLFIENNDKNIISLYRCFSREEIGKAIGYKKVLCVALIVSKLSNALKLDFYRLNKFKLD